ncbi:MAG: hypothetical protein LBQ00_01880 [Syntrophobacterales bacterium]|jgi:ABC-type phosphate/phosphonate transport system permease subunit|nr:hypothetical protein [Syntrophobacterales bacterium]
MTRRKTAYLWLNIASALTLLTGILSAVLIYQAADNNSGNTSMYEQGEDFTSPQDSKKYLRELEVYGGKTNVLATEIRVWFAGLWQGKSLAYMVACIGVLVSFALFYAANRRLPP